MKAKEICDILGVTKEGLKSILRRDQLAARLLEKNYRLIKMEKIGRANEFFVEEIVMVSKEQWDDYMKREMPNIRKVDAYGNYCEERLIKNSVVAKDIAKNVGVSAQTLVRWDDILVKKGIMLDNGYSYFLVKDKKSKPVQITYGEYLQYWKTKDKITPEEERLLEIIEGECPITHDMLHTAFWGGTCIKVKSYLVNEFTDAYEHLVAALNNRNK